MGQGEGSGEECKAYRRHGARREIDKLLSYVKQGKSSLPGLIDRPTNAQPVTNSSYSVPGGQKFEQERERRGLEDRKGPKTTWPGLLVFNSSGVKRRGVLALRETEQVYRTR